MRHPRRYHGSEVISLNRNFSSESCNLLIYDSAHSTGKNMMVEPVFSLFLSLLLIPTSWVWIGRYFCFATLPTNFPVNVRKLNCYRCLTCSVCTDGYCCTNINPGISLYEFDKYSKPNAAQNSSASCASLMQWETAEERERIPKNLNETPPAQEARSIQMGAYFRREKTDGYT